MPRLLSTLSTLCLLAGAVAAKPPKRPYLTIEELRVLREETQEMFFHGFDNYMAFAFPWDELKPLSCEPRRWDERVRGGVDDILGGYSLTLVDSLDSMAVMGEVDRFWINVKHVVDVVSFDRDVVVSVFESVIRILGGLLSAHQMAVGPMQTLAEERNFRFYGGEENDQLTEFRYDNQLLHLAVELGNRLLPAFDTPTSMPMYSVNLKYGKVEGGTTNAISSDVGTMLMELCILSRVSGDPKFEQVGRRAMRALYEMRTKIDLWAISVDVEDGIFTSDTSSVGPGLDSFFEYMIKSYYAFGDKESLDMFITAYTSIKKNMYYGIWQLDVNVYHGNKKAPLSYIISSLSAFWSGVQVSIGDVGEGAALHSEFMSLWLNFNALPESYDLVSEHITQDQKRNPLRPEFIESTFHLYQATRDPFYLKVGKKILFQLQNVSRVDCGFAGVADVEKKLDLEDRMDSYFFAETLKYMYMLFDLGIDDAVKGLAKHQEDVCAVAMDHPEGPAYAKKKNNWLTFGEPMDYFFTTEGHIFNSKAKGIRRRIDPETGEEVPVTPVSEFQRVGTKDLFYSNKGMEYITGVCLPIGTKKKW